MTRVGLDGFLLYGKMATSFHRLQGHIVNICFISHLFKKLELALDSSELNFKKFWSLLLLGSLYLLDFAFISDRSHIVHISTVHFRQEIRNCTKNSGTTLTKKYPL